MLENKTSNFTQIIVINDELFSLQRSFDLIDIRSLW